MLWSCSSSCFNISCISCWTRISSTTISPIGSVPAENNTSRPPFSARNEQLRSSFHGSNYLQFYYPVTSNSSSLQSSFFYAHLSVFMAVICMTLVFNMVYLPTHWSVIPLAWLHLRCWSVLLQKANLQPSHLMQHKSMQHKYLLLIIYLRQQQSCLCFK